MSTETPEVIPLDKLARTYRKIKAKLQEITAAYEAEEAALKAQIDVLSVSMKDQLLAAGLTSAKTTEGLIVLSKSTRYSTNDWAAFKDFVVAENALDLFEKRIAQGNMATFLKENPTKVPPGLNSNSEYSISVRKVAK